MYLAVAIGEFDVRCPFITLLCYVDRLEKSVGEQKIQKNSKA